MNIPNLRFAIWSCNSPCSFGAWLKVIVAAGLLCPALLVAQTVGTGNIVGLVTDTQGAVIEGARVEITNKATAAAIHVRTSSDGLYSSGAVVPGEYGVRIEAKSFKTAHMALVVQLGNTSNGNVKMETGQEVPMVEVPSTSLNFEQATVQGVLNGEQIEKLPISGRNFLDLAQLEPGVQIQDGSLFGTKNGLSTSSFEGGFGRTVRIDVDGVDVSDERVGTTTLNISAGAIQEFQLAQSLLDLSTGLTSTGAVNVTTRSGSNQVHGEAFGLFRGDQGAAALPGPTTPSFQREQFGGRLGGAIIKDKVFLFADAERTKQDFTAAVPFSPPFNVLNARLSQPYREFDADGRLDWNIKENTRAFYRFDFFQNTDLRPGGSASSAQQFSSSDHTQSHAIGVDFNKGAYAHSVRFEYLKFRNAISDATNGLSGVDNPIPGLGINIGATTAGNCVLSSGGAYCGGPSWLAPQATVQSNLEAKYDGSGVMGAHIIRYGATLNHIVGGGFASVSTFPQVGTTSLGLSPSSDPTSYAADYVSLGNGVGFSTAKSAFGFPGGELGPDNRLELYVGDGWKVRPRVTVTYGLHYVRDTGRTDSNLGSLPALNQWQPGLGNQIRNPGLNFAPQVGFAWDAGGNGKTVIRGGAGLFYDNSLWNNVLFDSSARLTKGVFADTREVCQGGVANAFNWPTNPGPVGASVAGAGTVVQNPTTGALQVSPNFCGGTISTVAPQILALSSAYQAATATLTGPQPNGNFVGTALTALNPSHVLLYPGYRTPRSWQINFGLQKEFRPGTVFSIDYVRNVGDHYLIGQDVNHSGAARSFNQANAVAARDKAQTANGCPTGFGQATCMIGKLGQAGAQLAYSTAGLDSNLQAAGGGPCSYCAFPGTNPISGNNGAVGGVDMLFPGGHSVYNGLQMKLVTRVSKPMQGVKSANFQIAYSYSKYVSQVQDQGAINLATDNDNLTRFTGPNGLDRKHQISFAGTFDLPFYTKLSVVGHFYSPVPENLLLPQLTHGGEIFATDWLGAGLGSAAAPEPLPGTQIGQFQRGTDITNLYQVINNYNHIFASALTPAGECLVANSTAGSNPLGGCPGQIAGPQVMTASDMTALGWVMPQLGSVATNAVGIPWLKSMDLKASWPIKFRDRVTIDPSASVFNVFNFSNAFPPGNLPGASLLPGQNGFLAPNVVGGVTPGSSLMPFRASFQSGTFALGAPRQFEFGLRISF